jgi:hypothetical protein
MIRPALIFLSTATILFFAACESDQDQKPTHSDHHRFGYGDTGTEVAPPPGGPTDTTPPAGPDTATPDNGPIAPTPPPPPPPTSSPTPADNGTGAPGADNGTAPKQHDYPYAQPVAGKPGFVTSPYAPYSGYVDVRGFPPGTEVKDPYTQKVFLVP